MTSIFEGQPPKEGLFKPQQGSFGFQVYIYSAAGNLQLYLPMRVVRFACQPQLPFRTIAAAMIYTGESCDDLLQASQTNWCRRLRHAANLVGFCSPFLTDF